MYKIIISRLKPPLFQGGIQSDRYRYFGLGLVEGQMLRSGRLFPVQLRDQSAARRKAITGHAQLTGEGQWKWTVHVAKRSGT